MEYREIRYTVRVRIERNEWTVSIHPAGIEGARRLVTGPRVRAELLARSMIDRWHAQSAARSGELIRAADRRRHREADKVTAAARAAFDRANRDYSNTCTTSEAEITPPAAMTPATARRSRARAVHSS